MREVSYAVGLCRLGQLKPQTRTKLRVGKLAQLAGNQQKLADRAIELIDIGGAVLKNNVYGIVELFVHSLSTHFFPPMRFRRLCSARNCNCLTAPSLRRSSTAMSRTLRCSMKRRTTTSCWSKGNSSISCASITRRSV